MIRHFVANLVCSAMSCEVESSSEPRLSARRNRHAHTVELAAGLGGLGRVGKAGDQGAQLAGGGVVFLFGEECHAFVEMGDGDLGIIGELLQDVVVVAHGVGEFPGAVVDFAKVIEGIAGEGIVRV